MFGGLQISRGCPRQCEFCDIIVTFGRRPRLKTSDQVIAELEAMRAHKLEMAFIVDDNLIGAKRAIKPVLADIARWQKENGCPFIFFAQASLDLADDEELLRMLIEANVQSVFIGVESPNEESLRATKKAHNLRAGGSMVDKILRIQEAGIEVWTGMIVGFDHDDETIFDAQVKFLSDARVVHASVGMLTAIPKTPLHDRLLAEDRLDLDDPPAYGTNVVPSRMTRETLRDGYIDTMRRLSEAEAYFGRVDSLYHDLGFQFNKAQRAFWRRHPVHWFSSQCKTLMRSAVLYRRLLKRVDEPELRDEYRRRVAKIWRRRREPAALFIYLIKCAMHYHYHTIVRDMAHADQPVINTF
jgi:radical SAM superfamily enzyme YgiQ (UPF0313 family)